MERGLLVAAAGDVVAEDPALLGGRGRSRRTAARRPAPASPCRGCRGSARRAGWPCRPSTAWCPRSSRSARARSGTAGPSRPRGRRCRRCRRTEYSSAGKTFSMSRWAMMLPIVARRSPAITTPPGNVAATIVVPCGRQVAGAALRARRGATGSRSGACVGEEVGERRGAGLQERRRQPRAVGEAHWPPFWMNDFTKSSALVSSTSSISSRIASTSSSSASLRSATSVSVRDLGRLLGLRATSAAASAPVPCLDPSHRQCGVTRREPRRSSAARAAVSG